MRGPAVVIVVVLLSVVTSIATVLGIERLKLQTPTPTEVPRVGVPSLKGLSEEDARQNLKALGLVFLVGQRKAVSGAAPGTVVEQTPVAGQKLEVRGSVTVSLARELPRVPSVVGRTLGEARALLAQNGYELEQGEPIANSPVPKGSIATQLPDADQPQESGTPVIVRISSGPSEIEVPKLLGQKLEKVKAQAKDQGFALKIVWTAVGETEQHVVLNQNPAAGTKIKPEDIVTITVNH